MATTPSSNTPPDPLDELKLARAKKEGDGSWVDGLAQLPEIPEGDKKVVVAIPKREQPKQESK